MLLHAQNNVAHDTLVVFGKVKDLLTSVVIPVFEARAVAVDDREHVLVAVMLGDGKYEFFITEERTYRITYSAPGYISKSVEIAVAGPTAAEWRGGFGMNVDITLPPEHAGYSPSLFKEPMGKCSYRADSLRYEWDLEYTRARMEQVRKAGK